jgi:uncharacterized OsmC-like protein
MEGILVEYRARDRFRLRIRGHELVIDQPKDAGGDDMGPTPTELFMAGLAGCVGFFAERYLRRHGLPGEGLKVECRFGMSEDRPSRVDAVEIRVFLPKGFPEERREPLLRVISKCTVHNTMERPPPLEIELVMADEPVGVSSAV